MVNSPLIRPYLLGGGTLDSYEKGEKGLNHLDDHPLSRVIPLPNEFFMAYKSG